MPEKNFIPLMLVLLALFASACAAQTGTQPAQTVPTQIVEPASTQPALRIPSTEAEVPRVTVAEAKAALDNGTAIFVDVRRAEAFEMSHISGALSIPLGEIETNPTGLNIAKDQWLIPYCT